jgi:hypothetical protein
MEASAPERPAWLPPLEARPDGTASLAPGRRRRLSPVAVAGGLLVVLMLAGVVAARAGGEGGNSAEAVARRFIDARASGDATTACRQLTVRARRDMVALVRGIEPPAASARDCERFVLTTSERSIFTDPALTQFRGRDMDVRIFPNREGAVIRAEGLGREPFLEARPVAGGWRLDGLASERASFILGCTDHGAAKRYCSCTFDRLAQRGEAKLENLRAADEQRVVAAARTCVRYAGRSQPK